MLENKNYVNEVEIETETETETEKEVELEQAEKEEQEEKDEVIKKGEKESKELNNEVRINNQIDLYFDKFNKDILKEGDPDYELRKERDLSIEKKDNRKLDIKSYGETCEVDLKTGKISYMKGGKSVEVERDAEPIIDISGKYPSIVVTDLYRVFGKMNVINRAMHLSNSSDEKGFKFETYYTAKRILTTKKHEPILSFKGLKKWFGDDIKEKEIIEMLNKVTNS